MATVDEIFESMAEISDELEESIDSAILIDPNTRQISLPGAELIFGVESDGKSERKYFICPRYVGNNLDLAACFIRVNYRNANGDVDAHLVDDVRVVGDSVMFSWELAEKVTQYMGQVKFVVCAIHGDHEWHTTVSTGVVLEGLEPDGEAIAGATDDAIAQLLTLVDAQSAKVTSEGTKQVASVQAAAEASRIAVEASIEAKGTATLASIPEDYQTLSNDVYGLKKTRATAIICEATGTTVAVNDASGNPLNGLRIFGRSTQDGVPTPDSPVDIVSVGQPTVVVTGKNLIPPGVSTLEAQGIKSSPAKNGTIMLTGTAAQEMSRIVSSTFPLTPGKYTLSVTGLHRVDGNKDRVYLSATDNSGTIVNYIMTNEPVTFDVTTYKTATASVVLAKGSTYDNEEVSIQLEVGDKATEYERHQVTHTLALATPILRGIPVTEGGNYIDENGQRWICDEVDLERGVYVQRIGTAVFTEEDVLSYQTNTIRLRKDISSINQSKAWCNVTNNYVYHATLDEVHFYVTGSNCWVFVPIGYDLSTNSVVLNYQHATPIETPLSDVEIASYRAIRTVFPNTTILNSAGAHMIVDYAADTKSYIDNLLKG